MSLDNSLVVIQSKNKKYLTVLTSGDEFIINDGKISYDDIETLPVQVQSSTGDYFNIYTPTYKEFVLLMRRGPQIIYPKDVGSIIVDGNIKNNSTVLEIGTGSGALTLFLILIFLTDSLQYLILCCRITVMEHLDTFLFFSICCGVLFCISERFIFMRLMLRLLFIMWLTLLTMNMFFFFWMI